MKDSWVDKQMVNITNDWYLKGEVGTGVTINIPEDKWAYNVTPNLIKSFREVEARMEKEAKEKELREKQLQNKRLRGMVKKVITNEPYTIIMWNDGTKTVTKCHKFDTYDSEKGILACMAKKLYENTNLFNEIIQEYVDFDFEKDTCDLAAHVRQAYNIEIRKLKNDNKCLENRLGQAEKMVCMLEDKLSIAKADIANLMVENRYLKDVDSQTKADTQICEGIIVELQEKINNLEAQKEILEDRLIDADCRIDDLEDELYWRDCQIDDLREELYEAKTNCSE